jgi:AcrR family transcriptional regulator
MSNRAPRTPSHQVREEVIRAAIEILDTNGPDGFTVRAVADVAGVASMAIYNHFEGMNGLLDALWKEGFDGFASALGATTGNARSDLISAGLNYRRYALSHRGLYTVMFLHTFKHFKASAEGDYAAAKAFQVLENLVRNGQREKLIRAGNSIDLAQLVWSTCHGFVALELKGENFSTNTDENYDALLLMLFEGLRA